MLLPRKACACAGESSRQRVDLVGAIELSDGQKAVGTEGQVGQIDQAMEVSGSAGDSAPAFYDGKVRAIGDCRIWGASEFDVLVLIAISEQGIILDLADEHRRDAEGKDFAGLEGFDKRASSSGLGFLPVLGFSLGVEEFFCQCREADREGIAHGRS